VVYGVRHRSRLRNNSILQSRMQGSVQNIDMSGSTNVRLAISPSIGLSISCLRGGFFVSLEVEVDKEDKVAGQQETAEESCSF